MSRGRGDFGYGSISQNESGEFNAVPPPRPAERRVAMPVNSDYKELCDKISGHIFTIGANVGSMEQALKQLGTSRDSMQLRQKIHDIEKTTNSLVKETTSALGQLSSLSSRSSDAARTYRLQSQRLMGEFKEVTQRYHTLQKKVAEKVRSTEPPPSSSSASLRVPTGDLLGWDEANEDDAQRLQQRQQQMQLAEEAVNTEIAILQERETQIRQLEGDILDINQIFRDLGMMVHEQGETIDTIESHVSVAGDNVEQGTEQLVKASRYQTSARKKMCILLVILLVIVAIIVIIVVVSVKTRP